MADVDIVFHGTKASNLESIRERGLLIPDGQVVAHSTINRTRRIYAAKFFETAIGYAQDCSSVLVCLALPAGYERQPMNFCFGLDVDGLQHKALPRQTAAALAEIQSKDLLRDHMTFDRSSQLLACYLVSAAEAGAAKETLTSILQDLPFLFATEPVGSSSICAVPPAVGPANQVDDDDCSVRCAMLDLRRVREETNLWTCTSSDDCPCLGCAIGGPTPIRGLLEVFRPLLAGVIVLLHTELLARGLSGAAELALCLGMEHVLSASGLVVLSHHPLTAVQFSGATCRPATRHGRLRPQTVPVGGSRWGGSARQPLASVPRQPERLGSTLPRGVKMKEETAKEDCNDDGDIGGSSSGSGGGDDNDPKETAGPSAPLFALINLPNGASLGLGIVAIAEDEQAPAVARVRGAANGAPDGFVAKLEASVESVSQATEQESEICAAADLQRSPKISEISESEICAAASPTSAEGISGDLRISEMSEICAAMLSDWTAVSLVGKLARDDEAGEATKGTKRRWAKALLSGGRVPDTARNDLGGLTSDEASMRIGSRPVPRLLLFSAPGSWHEVAPMRRHQGSSGVIRSHQPSMGRSETPAGALGMWTRCGGALDILAQDKCVCQRAACVWGDREFSVRWDVVGCSVQRPALSTGAHVAVDVTELRGRIGAGKSTLTSPDPDRPSPAAAEQIIEEESEAAVKAAVKLQAVIAASQRAAADRKNATAKPKRQKHEEAREEAKAEAEAEAKKAATELKRQGAFHSAVESVVGSVVGAAWKGKRPATTPGANETAKAPKAQAASGRAAMAGSAEMRPAAMAGTGGMAGTAARALLRTRQVGRQETHGEAAPVPDPGTFLEASPKDIGDPSVDATDHMALRVGTLNVHRWADARNSGNFERIASLLLPLSLDIVVLQEAGPFTRKPTGGPELAARLGLAHVRVTGDVVLLSRFPLNDRMPLGRQNKRLLLVDVALPMYGGAHSNAFELLCVHLDHRTEEHRLGQLEAVRGATALTAERRGGPLAGSLLLGDLNALTRDDYTAEAWERVAAVRSENGWEPPKCAVTRALRADGWSDCWETHQQQQQSAGGAAAARDGSLVGTCRFDTRIDYVYADESFSRNWRLRSCAHVATTATDHKLVIVEFEARRAPGHEGQPAPTHQQQPRLPQPRQSQPQPQPSAAPAPPTPPPAPGKGAAPAQTGAGNPTGGFAAAVHANVDPNALLRMYDTAAPCGTLVVAFAALGGGTAGVARHEFVGACRRCGASHALFVRDARRSWYLLGLGEHGGAALSGREGFDSVVDAVEREVAALRPARVVVVGASMGGYAAIRAGIALRAESVVAFSPQVFIDREERSRLALPPSSFDADLSRVQAGCAQRGMTRLPSAIDALLGSSAVLGAGSADGEAAEVAAVGCAVLGTKMGAVGRAAERCPRIEVHVGSGAAGDVREAKLLCEALARSGHGAACSMDVHPHCGHMLVGDLRNRGALDVLLHRVLGTAPPGGLEVPGTLGCSKVSK